MKKNAFTVSEFVFGLTAVGLLTLTLFPEFYQREEVPYRAPNCQDNLKQLGVGFIQYSQDWDERFPVVRSGREGWKNALIPYMKNEEVFQCPQESKGEVLGTTDYFYNANLSRVNQWYLMYKANIILAGDGAGNSLTNFSITKLPKSWTLNQKSPALRHLNGPNNGYAEDEQHKDGANYLYATGAVKWLRPERLTNQKPASGTTTFEVS